MWFLFSIKQHTKGFIKIPHGGPQRACSTHSDKCTLHFDITGKYEIHCILQFWFTKTFMKFSDRWQEIHISYLISTQLLKCITCRCTFAGTEWSRISEVTHPPYPHKVPYTWRHRHLIRTHFEKTLICIWVLLDGQYIFILFEFC